MADRTHFEQLEPTSRVWIYQANRELTKSESESLKHEIDRFLASWQSHGNSMTAACEVFLQRVLVIGADEQKMSASGCSIDKLNRLIIEQGNLLHVDLFDRRTVLFELNSTLQALALHEFWAMRKAGRINGDTLVYDNTVATVSKFRSNWKRPFYASWHQELWQR
jgi:hypothetical protein